MNKKTIVVLSSLTLLTLSFSIGLTGCKEKQDTDSASVRPIIDFDQDDDPYPDDYLLEDVPDSRGKALEGEKAKKTKKVSKALNAATIKIQLENAFPGIKIETVSKGPVPYLYQVKTEGDVFFTTTDGQLMFVGDLIGLKGAKTNYTEQVRTADRYALLKTLNVNDTINFDPKNPKYTITVFTDTDCGYCRKFHQHIQEINALGIAVHYAAFPRAGLESKTFEKMQMVWCAKDKNAAYTSVINAQDIPKQSCSTQSVQNQYHLGQKLGIRGTPALILQDGSLIPGYMPPDSLKAMLDKHFESKAVI